MNLLTASLLAATLSLSAGEFSPQVSSFQPDARPQPAVATSARPIIHVTATGEVQRRPDYALVFVGVELREERAEAASDRAGKAIQKITAALEALKIASLQIQTSEVRLTTAYNWNQGNESRTLLGYDATTTIRVRVDDPKSVGKIIDAATSAGANRIDGISFEINQALEARQEALRLAARAAKDKAATLAEALDMRLGSVIEATTSNAEPRLWMNQSQYSNLAQAQRAPEGGFDGGIEPGFVTVRADVTVTFAASTRN